MGHMPVNKLLLTMAIPIILSMLVQALYNVVDSIFVGQLNQDALNAVSLALPIQNLIISVAVGTAVGMNALLARYLGQGNQDKANMVAMQGIFLSIVSAVGFAIIGLTCSRLYYTAQTDVSRIVAYGEDYMLICTMGSMGILVVVMLERILQATGRTVHTMITQAVGAIINIVLDPILIFGLFGFPRMEVAGAAVATIIGQAVSALLCLYFNIRHNPDIHLNFRDFRPNVRIIGDIYKIGVPSIAMSSVGSVMVFGMNQILLAFSTTATAVFGIYFKLQSFVFMPVFGLCNGMIPIIAYNYGARKPDRIITTVKLGMVYATGMMVLGFAMFQLIPAPMLALFQEKGASTDLITIGVPALRIISISFLFAGYCIVSSVLFQALGHSMLSLFMSLVRQLVFLLPTALLLAHFFGLSVIWWAFPMAEMICFVLANILLVHIYRSNLVPLKNPL